MKYIWLGTLKNKSSRSKKWRHREKQVEREKSKDFNNHVFARRVNDVINETEEANSEEGTTETE